MKYDNGERIMQLMRTVTIYTVNIVQLAVAREAGLTKTVHAAKRQDWFANLAKGRKFLQLLWRGPQWSPVYYMLIGFWSST